MRLASLTLENFRSFRDSTSIPNLGGINVFVGRNNSGKSNIIEALRYISALSQASPFRNYIEMVFDRDENKSIEFHLLLQLDDHERASVLSKWFEEDNLPRVLKSRFLREVAYTVELASWGVKKEQLRISNFLDGQLLVDELTSERASWQEQSVDLEKDLPSLFPVEQGFEVSNISPEPKSAASGIGARGFRLLSLSRREISDLVLRFMADWFWISPSRKASFQMTAQHADRLDFSGSNLAQVLNTMQSEDPERFVEFKNEVVKILPEVEKLLAPLSGTNVTLVAEELGLKNRIDLGNMSFGIMEIMLLVTCLFTAPSGSIVLIEEPEIHLHAGAARRLLEFIRRYSNDKQVFLTTHSPIFSNLAENSELYLVTKSKGASRLRRIAESSELRLVKMELGHRNIDLYGDEGVVFIEGDSEEVALPVIAEALGYDLVAMGIRLVNVKGSGKFNKMTEYLRYIEGSGAKPFVMADGHKTISQRLDDWIRDGLIDRERVFVWDLEFEDCFTSKTLVNALKRTLPTLKVNEKDLQEKPADTPVVRVIEKLLYEQNLPRLDKSELAENLALELKKEIETDKSHGKTPPEEAIIQIVKLVESTT